MIHLSAGYLGPRHVLTPRIPRDRMAFENRTVRRICVAPTLTGCLLAVRGCYYNRGLWHVYVTSTETVEPIAVPDAQETGERWLLQAAEFHYAGSLQADVSHAFKTRWV